MVYKCIQKTNLKLFTIVKNTLFSFVNMKNEMLRNIFEDEFYDQIKFSKVTGRYVSNSSLKLVLDEFKKEFDVNILGQSVQGRSIYRVKLGTGKIKILAWSQMHGNEATTTKAVFDLFNTLKMGKDQLAIKSILKNCTLHIIPILNPDGAEVYTRVNANHIDLNRDLQNLSQPESRILKDEFDQFKPDYCLNLHDQRTIFSAGNHSKSAVLSFLTPSKDEERSIDANRKLSMALIAGIAQDLSVYLPGSIGRYDDAFNINCAGDTFQNLSVPTILFEAGHSPGDYEREETRKQVYRALISCLHQISQKSIELPEYQDYFNIPENEKLFNDIVIRRAILNGKRVDISIQFRETLENGKILFIPVVEKIATEIQNYGHKEIDAEENVIKTADGSEFLENVVVSKIILNNEELEVNHA